MGNLIINYKSYKNVTKILETDLDILNNVIDSYITSMVQVNYHGFISGEIAEAWVDLTSYVSYVRDYPKEVKTQLSKAINSYLDDLDNAQKYKGNSILYDYSYKKNKNYTSEHFRDLKKHVESDGYDDNLLKKAGNALENGWHWLGSLIGHNDNSKSKNIKKTQEHILQWRDITKGVLRTIEIDLNTVDSRYSKKLEGIYIFVNQIQDYLSKVKEILLNSDPNNFSISQYKGELDGKLCSLVSSYNAIINSDIITNEDVEKFLENEDEKFLSEAIDDIHEYLSDLSQIELFDADFWKILIYQQFNIVEGQITSLGNYEEMLMKKELMEMFDDISSTEYYWNDSMTKDCMDNVKSILDEIKDSGKDLYEYLNSHRNPDGSLILDGRTKEAKNFLKFLDKFEKAGKIIDLGEKGAEFIYGLFVDYEKNLKFLESFENNAQISGEMKEVFKSIHETYEKELTSLVDQSIQLALSEGISAVYGLCPVSKVIGTVKSTIGIIGNITGDSNATAARYELLSYGWDYVNSAESAFKNSYQKLLECSKNSDNYQEYLNDFKACFSVYKNSIIRIYEKMANASDGKQRDYYYYCSSQLAHLSLKNYNDINIMSYDEFNNAA